MTLCAKESGVLNFQEAGEIYHLKLLHLVNQESYVDGKGFSLQSSVFFLEVSLKS